MNCAIMGNIKRCQVVKLALRQFPLGYLKWVFVGFVIRMHRSPKRWSSFQKEIEGWFASFNINVSYANMPLQLSYTNLMKQNIPDLCKIWGGECILPAHTNFRCENMSLLLLFCPCLCILGLFPDEMQWSNSMLKLVSQSNHTPPDSPENMGPLCILTINKCT